MGPVRRRVSPSIKFAGTHLYPRVKRDTEHNMMSLGRALTQTAESRGERSNLEPTPLYQYGRKQTLLWKWCTWADLTCKSKTGHSHWSKILISSPFFGRWHTSSELFTVWTNLWHQNFPREVLWIYQVSWPSTWPYVLLILLRISATQPPLFLFNGFFLFWTDFIRMIKL